MNIEKPIKHEAKKSADDKDWELVPPDGGWGWLILAGSMLVNLLVPGTVKSFGVLFVEFVEAFDASPATAAWIPALCYFLYSSLGMITNINNSILNKNLYYVIDIDICFCRTFVEYFISEILLPNSNTNWRHFCFCRNDDIVLRIVG